MDAVWVSDAMLCLDLSDGRSICTPLHFYPSLLNSSPATRDHYEIHGGTVYWATLRLRLSSSDLLVGRRK
ncbi:MAG: DUF2442 domain-containing protein [Verrucomicrobiota bacterium]